VPHHVTGITLWPQIWGIPARIGVNPANVVAILDLLPVERFIAGKALYVALPVGVLPSDVFRTQFVSGFLELGDGSGFT